MRPVVIRFGRLGDMLLLAPLLARLRRGYGEACVLLGTGPWSAALYAPHPAVAEVVQVTARHRPLALSPARWRMVRVLQQHRAAAIHIGETEPRALAKIRRMLALARVSPEHCTFITDTPARADEHWSDRLLRTCGEPPPACRSAWQAPPSDAPAPRLYLTADERVDCDAWLQARGWRGEPLWLVQPCNKRSIRWHGARTVADDTKAWPEEHWITALHALHSQDAAARIILCGAPHEAPALAALAASTGLACLDVAARDLPLRRLMALAARARGMLSVDTGPAHVAAAMGCPLVVLFGAESPHVWCPRSPTGSAVVALGGPPQQHRVADIAPAVVIAALQNLPPRAPVVPSAT